jgi:hypothetical protein
MSLEMAHKVIVPPKKNYIPQFLKQRDINSYYTRLSINATISVCNVHGCAFQNKYTILPGSM